MKSVKGTMGLRLQTYGLVIFGKYIKCFMKMFYFHKNLCHKNICNIHITMTAKGVLNGFHIMLSYL